VHYVEGMRKARSWVWPMILAIIASGCGPIADSNTAMAGAPEMLDPLPPVTTAAPRPAFTPSTTTTTPAATTATVAATTIPATTTTSVPTFTYSVEPVTEDVVWATWREDCPLHYSELSLITMNYWNFDGEVTTGKMVVNTAVVEDLATAFEGLFDIRFPIERMELVDNYGGDDKAAMRANATSSFNCRFVDGTDRWSNHAFGLAVDINPLINPWAREGDVLPVEGERYVDRDQTVPGTINEGDEIITVFEDVGWSWGGVWQSADYMHFSKPGN
jgi:hypothetical protein